MLGLFLILSACTLWAIDTLIRYPLIGEGVSAISIVFYEHLFLSLIFSVVFFKSIKTLWSAKASHFAYFFIIGAIGSALATLSFTRAFFFLNPSVVILLQKFQPVVVILLANQVLHEKINKNFLIWAGLALIGAFLIGFDDMSKLDYQSFDVTADGALQGYILVFFSVIGWGCSTVFGKKLATKGYSNEQIMAGRFTLGLAAMTPFYWVDTQIFTHNIEIYSKVSLMILLSGLLAMYLYYQGLRKLSARSAALAEMFFPFMAVLVNWIFLGSTLNLVQLVGGGILLLSSVVIQLKHY